MRWSGGSWPLCLLLLGSGLALLAVLPDRSLTAGSARDPCTHTQGNASHGTDRSRKTALRGSANLCRARSSGVTLIRQQYARGVSPPPSPDLFHQVGEEIPGRLSHTPAFARAH